MNFFEHQDRARRNTGVLVLLFAGAVLCICLGLYVTGVWVAAFVDRVDDPQRMLRVDWFRGDVFGWTLLLVLSTVGLGSLYKIRQLSGGGASVALSVGGRLVEPSQATDRERVLLNVVEEMAIASGTPMPLVFVLDEEPSINAFAAGYSQDDAAVAVTRGCLELLTRDELQGVIAHEFSHILNGDMRMNVRLMGILHGILVIGLTGLYVMRGAARIGSGNRSNRKDNNGGLIVGLMAIGAILTVIGYAGVFFGRLIKAAVSRQREFLADASAVQFTRNPLGLAGALKKIGGLDAGSRVEAEGAEALSHLFFANGVRAGMFLSLLKTHPDLGERIRRVDPAFGGEFQRILPTPALEASVSAASAASAAAESAAMSGFSTIGAGSRSGIHGVTQVRAGNVRVPVALRAAPTPASIIASIGAPTATQLEYSRVVLREIPAEVRRAAEDPAGAMALVFALLLEEDAEGRVRQFGMLRDRCDPAVFTQMLQLGSTVSELPRAVRLPLAELSCAALRRVTAEQFRAFLAQAASLSESDGVVSVFEFSLLTLVGRSVGATFQPGGPNRRTEFFSFSGLRAEISSFLSFLAHAGSHRTMDAQGAFEAGARRMRMVDPAGIRLLRREECDLTRLDFVLDRLSAASPNIRQVVLEAAAHVVLSDGRVGVEEAELLRAVSIGLGCPLPPFLALEPDEGEPAA